MTNTFEIKKKGRVVVMEVTIMILVLKCIFSGFLLGWV